MIPRELGSHLFQLVSKDLTHFNNTVMAIIKYKRERLRRRRRRGRGIEVIRREERRRGIEIIRREEEEVGRRG